MRSVFILLPPLAIALSASCEKRAAAPADRGELLPMIAAERAPQGLRLQQAASLAMWTEQKLIRSAELRIQVESVPLAVERADSISREFEAFLADMRITQDDRGRRSAALVIRAPTARFPEVLDHLRGLGEVKTDAVTTEDVTKAYADLETRLAVKEETAARLRRLLADRTGNLSDVLNVERELSRVVFEIEQMKGERRYYDHRIAVSTISVTLLEPGAFLQPGSTVPITAAFGRALQVLSISVAWLVYIVTFLTPWLVVTGLGWWVVKRIRARRAA
jgi:hypothetical protein